MYTRHHEYSEVDETCAIRDLKPHSLREEAAIVISHAIFHNSHEESEEKWLEKRESLKEEPGLRGRPRGESGVTSQSADEEEHAWTQEKQEERPLDQPEKGLSLYPRTMNWGECRAEG